MNRVSLLAGLCAQCMAPFLVFQDVTYTPRIAMRRSASVPGHDKTILLGSNTVGVGGGELYAFSTSDAIPELGVRRVAGQLESFAKAAKAASDAGLDAHAHFGIRKLLWDDSIDLIGPSERAMRQIELCNSQGIPTTVLSMYEMSFEAALLPEIPCMNRWAARADALAGSGADGVYLWKMGPYYGGFSSEIYKHFMWNPAPDQEELLSKLAARVAGFKAGPIMLEAWRNVSEAIGWSPEIATYYKGPLYLGPAHPMIADKAAEVPDFFPVRYIGVSGHA